MLYNQSISTCTNTSTRSINNLNKLTSRGMKSLSDLSSTIESNIRNKSLKSITTNIKDIINENDLNTTIEEDLLEIQGKNILNRLNNVLQTEKNGHITINTKFFEKSNNLSHKRVYSLKQQFTKVNCVLLKSIETERTFRNGIQMICDNKIDKNKVVSTYKDTKNKTSIRNKSFHNRNAQRNKVPMLITSIPSEKGNVRIHCENYNSNKAITITTYQKTRSCNNKNSLSKQRNSGSKNKGGNMLKKSKEIKEIIPKRKKISLLY